MTAVTIGAANVDSTFNGRITNGAAAGATVSIIKTGSGTLTLNGTNTYTGTTTVQSGTLLVNGTHIWRRHLHRSGTLGGTGLSIRKSPVSGQIVPGSDTIATLTVASLALSDTTSIFRSAAETRIVLSSEFPTA